MSFDLKLVAGDLSISNGSLAVATGSDKLIQDILKISVTPAGANPFALWYGSLIAKTLIGSHLDHGIIVEAATNQLQIALNTYQSLQSLQLQSFQKLSADEQLASVLNIDVQRNKYDPRYFTVSIAVLNRAYQKIHTSFTVSLF